MSIPVPHLIQKSLRVESQAIYSGTRGGLPRIRLRAGGEMGDGE